MDIRPDAPRKKWGNIAAVAAAGLAVIVAAGWLFIALGAYNVAADAVHTRAMSWLLTKVRTNSVRVRASGIAVPSDLSDSTRISTGAGLYNEMCSGCHLAPGMEKTEISQGLYPAAPELSHGSSLTPGEKFWVIKHGVKMTGMAAWGKTHSDTLIWDMVAFLQKLPTLTPTQYQTLVKSAPEDHDKMMKMEGAGH